MASSQTQEETVEDELNRSRGLEDELEGAEDEDLSDRNNTAKSKDDGEIGDDSGRSDHVLGGDSEFANLDSAFQNMTDFADSLIESIRNDHDSDDSISKHKKKKSHKNKSYARDEASNVRGGGGGGGERRRRTSSKGYKNHHDHHHHHHHDDDFDSDNDTIEGNHDDDEIAREMRRLRMVSEELRQNLEDVDNVIEQMHSGDERDQDDHLSTSNQQIVPNSHALVVKTQGRYYPGAGGSTLNYVLLIVNLIIMTLLGRIMYHSMYYMLDEEGRMTWPF